MSGLRLRLGRERVTPWWTYGVEEAFPRDSLRSGIAGHENDGSV